MGVYQQEERQKYVQALKQQVLSNSDELMVNFISKKPVIDIVAPDPPCTNSTQFFFYHYKIYILYS